MRWVIECEIYEHDTLMFVSEFEHYLCDIELSIKECQMSKKL